MKNSFSILMGKKLGGELEHRTKALTKTRLSPCLLCLALDCTMKYVVDTSLINKLLDGSIHVDELPTDGSFVASHIQIDKINQTKNKKRRLELLKKFVETIDEVLPTESFVLGTSRLGEAKLGDGVSYYTIKTELDSKNRSKSNNSEDALIAAIAMNNGFVLLTADHDLYQVAYKLGIGAIYWATT